MRCIGETSKSIPEGEWLCAECSLGGRGAFLGPGLCMQHVAAVGVYMTFGHGDPLMGLSRQCSEGCAACESPLWETGCALSAAWGDVGRVWAVVHFWAAVLMACLASCLIMWQAGCPWWACVRSAHQALQAVLSRDAKAAWRGGGCAPKAAWAAVVQFLGHLVCCKRDDEHDFGASSLPLKWLSPLYQAMVTTGVLVLQGGKGCKGKHEGMLLGAERSLCGPGGCPSALPTS